MRMRIGIGFVACVLVTVLASACRRDPKVPDALSRDTVTELRKAFNEGADGPRVIVFFSSGCAACDTGSRALQKTLETIEGRVTIVGVWEPIFEADPAPTPNLFGNIKDVRVRQVWDPDHIMSDAMRASEVAHPGSPSQARTRTNNADAGIMYDTVAIFRPGARWEATLPAPDYVEVGLESILPQVREQIIAMQAGKPH